MDDQQIIKGVLQNHEPSFRCLIDKYKRLVFGSAFRILRNTSDAEDVSQEVFIEVFRSIHKLRNEDDLSGWLFKIAKNKSISFLRKKNPAKANSTGDIHAEFTQQNLNKAHIEHHTAAHAMEDTEIRQALFTAIDLLPEKQKKVLLLHKFEDFSHNEICKALQLSQSSVESLIYRAKSNLKKSLFCYFKNHLI